MILAKAVVGRIAPAISHEQEHVAGLLPSFCARWAPDVDSRAALRPPHRAMPGGSPPGCLRAALLASSAVTNPESVVTGFAAFSIPRQTGHWPINYLSLGAPFDPARLTGFWVCVFQHTRRVPHPFQPSDQLENQIMNALVTAPYHSVQNMRYDETAVTKGGNAMQKLCKNLLPLWFMGAFPVAFITCLCLSWDHRFGHPPVGEWIFAACYALLGVVMYRAASRVGKVTDHT
jgi:hypothetical protein